MALRSIEADARRLYRFSGLSPHLTMLEQAWQSEMGGWSAWAEVAALERATLVIEVRSSAAMQEITLRRRELVRRLNRYFPDPFVRDLAVRMAPRG